MTMKILAVGDVCGEPGLGFLDKRLKAYRNENDIDFVVVNGENANVVGITPRQADAILRSGADVITLGNHTWTRTELRPYLDERRRILRPANFAPQCPGKGINVYHTNKGDVCVLNLMGRFTLDANTDNPFVIADGYMEEIQEKVILVDFLKGRIQVQVGRMEEADRAHVSRTPSACTQRPVSVSISKRQPSSLAGPEAEL